MTAKMPTSYQKRVIFLVNNTEDINPQVVQIMKGLQDHGHEVIAISDDYIQLFKLFILDKLWEKIQFSMLFWWALWCSWFYRPDVIILENIPYIIPCFKLFTNARIIQLRYFMVKKPRNKTNLEIPSDFEKKCVRLADDIIVPSQMAAKLVNDNYQLQKLPRVIYPCVDIPVTSYTLVDQKLLEFISEPWSMFLYITDLGPSCEILQMVTSLCSLCDAYKERWRETPKLLIVVKNRNTADNHKIDDAREYIIKNDGRYKLASKVYIHFEDDEAAIHEILKKSDYLISTSSDEIYNEYFMLSIKYGIPIIGNKAGFGEEIIRNGYNGIFVGGTSNQHAEAISCLFLIPTAKKYTKIMQILYYCCTYNYRQFAINHNACIVENTEGLKVSILQDMLTRVHWRSVMYKLRFEMACGYLTGFGNMPDFYLYFKEDEPVRSRIFFLNGGFRIGNSTILKINARAAGKDLRTLELKLGWKEVKCTLKDKGENQKPEDVIINNYLEQVLEDMKKNKYIHKNNYRMTKELKYIIMKCAVSMD